jgi:ferritin
MLNERITALINDQINMEWYSAYFYLSIHSYYVDQELNGFGNWFYVQTQEERDHATLFIKYLQNNSEKIQLFDVKAPSMPFGDFRAEYSRGIRPGIA